ncbi:MAG: phosphoribosylamine--glycine ligase [Thermoplasmataceae archaeon]
MNRILLVGGGGREDAIGRKIVDGGASLYCVARHLNPSLARISRDYRVMDELSYDRIVQYALEMKIDLMFVGPDPVLETPLVDLASKAGILVPSPSRAAARIETSKEYMRSFLKRNGIRGNIFSRIFSNSREVAEFIRSSDLEFAIKPIGLTGGKGVRVMGVQINSREEAAAYAAEVAARDGKVLLEERIGGEEFSLQVFSDGKSVSPMPLAQDYKRALEGDKGPNTGGMGSITGVDYGLPFIAPACRDSALGIIRSVVHHMNLEGNPFQGVMYGQFMQVNGEAKIVEINARFADPEGINVLYLLDENLPDILFRIADSSLGSYTRFLRKATTLKYIVPNGYGSDPQPGSLEVELANMPEDLQIYYASVSGTPERVQMTSSRALAVIARSETIESASDSVEENMWRIKGDFYVRHDIGSREFLKEKMS